MKVLELSIAQLIELAQTLDKAKEDLRIQMNELKAENEELKARMNDGWTDRVTYDNMVEQIASYEDPAQRDEARKLIEPMLKKNMVRKLRADIKRKVNESNEGNGANITIQQAEVKGAMYEISGNNNVNLGNGDGGKTE